MQDVCEGLVPIKVRRFGLDKFECQDSVWSNCIRKGASFSINTATRACCWWRTCIKVLGNLAYKVSKTRFGTIVLVLATEIRRFLATSPAGQSLFIGISLIQEAW